VEKETSASRRAVGPVKDVTNTPANTSRIPLLTVSELASKRRQSGTLTKSGTLTELKRSLSNLGSSTNEPPASYSKKTSTSVTNRVLEWEREKQRLREMERLEDLERERDEYFEQERQEREQEEVFRREQEEREREMALELEKRLAREEEQRRKEAQKPKIQPKPVLEPKVHKAPLTVKKGKQATEVPERVVRTPKKVVQKPKKLVQPSVNKENVAPIQGHRKCPSSPAQLASVKPVLSPFSRSEYSIP